MTRSPKFARRGWQRAVGVAVCTVVVLWVAGARAMGRTLGSTEPNFDTSHIHVMHVRGNVYMLVGAGSNITVQVGEQYVIVVDTGLPEFADEVIAVVQKISTLPIMFVGNTGPDADHTGGNAKFFDVGKALPNATVGLTREDEKDSTRLHLFPGATIVASFNAVKRTAEEAGKTTSIGFGPEGFKLYNGEGVVFYHMAKAHTDGDSVCFFRASDVISTGDVFTTTGYPVIATERGGTVGGFIDALNDLIEIMIPRYGEEGGTYVIPGHGHLSDRADVVNYRDMVTIVRGRVQEMAKNGLTLAQIRAERPTLDYDGLYGAEGGRAFIDIVYQEVTTKGKK